MLNQNYQCSQNETLEGKNTTIQLQTVRLCADAVVFLLTHNPELTQAPPQSRAKADRREYAILERTVAPCLDWYCWPLGGGQQSKPEGFNSATYEALCTMVSLIPASAHALQCLAVCY